MLPKSVFRFSAMSPGQFVLRVFHAPTVEVRGFPVVVVQHLTEYLFVFRVAERRRVAPYPLFSLLFPGEVRAAPGRMPERFPGAISLTLVR